MPFADAEGDSRLDDRISLLRRTNPPIGVWQPVLCSAADFWTSDGAGTWTVECPPSGYESANSDVTAYRWMLLGNTMFINFSLEQTSVGGTPGFGQNMKIRGGYTARSRTTTTGPPQPSDSAPTAFGGGQNYVQLRKAPATGWSTKD